MQSASSPLQRTLVRLELIAVVFVHIYGVIAWGDASAGASLLEAMSTGPPPDHSTDMCPAAKVAPSLSP